jgi:hypothetical protein
MPTEHLSYADVAAANPRAVIGGNAPPPKSPYEAAKDRIEELYTEARGWLDGDPIASQEQADAIQKLMRLIQEAEKVADEARKAEAKPFDDGKAEVQARYNPLIQKDKGKTALAVNACKSALAPWLRKLDEIQRAAAEVARKEAEDKRLAAMEAMRQRDATNLQQQEAAEALVAEAKQAEAAAKKAENAKPQAKGAGRAASLRTYYTANVTDYKAFARYLWVEHPDVLEPFLDELASKMASAGSRELPGVSIVEDRRVA